MLDLRTVLCPPDDRAPVPPPVAEIVSRVRSRRVRRHLGVAAVVLSLVALAGIVVVSGGDAAEPGTRTGLPAGAGDTTVTTAAPPPSTPTTAVTTTTPPAPSGPGRPSPTSIPDPTTTGPPPPSPPSTTPLAVIQDTDVGTGSGQVAYSPLWYDCTTTCDKAPDGTYRWTRHVGETATIRFEGTGVALFGVREPWAHIATVFIDGGAAVDVDFYAAPASARPVEVFRSGPLADGPHTLVLTMSDRRNPASSGGNAITFDRAEITTT